ncbi:uncharacterized protein A1O9_01761 [Exophiala aquamarina CBS 119918]|uniref:NAD(P)-binding domain-containing protein n=1 Tax=Exophiala aquamarina CBS 119918 TaxID=1182545 RepID=A0A072PWQ9_9EURO|nr:uncharacterized protein A1O9_01761 [Exophiala aquamarina CBS 119918]KEF63783.1 hypothetical protein A1O9_01761 [Exophiala aquamarina CBS 119918]
MKVVLSGSTGYIGGEVLRECLDHPSITSVIVLTRRDPGSIADNAKAKVIIVKDFTAYDEATISELRTADAAIWCLGTMTGDERVDIEFPLAFIKIIKTRPIGSKPFRFVQLSGALTEPPPKDGQQARALWFFANGRRVRGLMEAKVLETAEDASPAEYAVYLVKPAGVAPKTTTGTILRCIMGDSLSISIRDLSLAVVGLAVNGNEQKVLSNREIMSYARSLREGTT